jgi:hypothetical protein
MAKTTCFLSSSVLVVVGSFSLNPYQHFQQPSIIP